MPSKTPEDSPMKVKRTCPECGVEFTTPDLEKMFCTPAHRAAFHNRSSKVGRSLVPLAQAWRDGRNAKGNSPRAKALRASAARAFADMCRVLDAAAADDRVVGRQSKLDYVRGRWASEGTLSADERISTHKAAAEAKAAAAKQG